jgi:hypothetical protein
MLQSWAYIKQDQKYATKPNWQSRPLFNEKLEYKFDQLKVETLEGTLNIGLNQQTYWNRGLFHQTKRSCIAESGCIVY